ncbi:MAG TPA: hypothetical protein VKV20_10690 [Ktedonobacteraceae bacterium]|nr:hypothetical protein [Ktedonobacteraceae bacterium]
MTTNTGQPANQDTAYDTLLRELMGGGWNLKAEPRSEQVMTRNLTEILMKELAKSFSQASPYEQAVLVAALAPSLAEALAPQLAEALTPALAKALTDLAAQNKTNEESSSGEDSYQQG